MMLHMFQIIFQTFIQMVNDLIFAFFDWIQSFHKKMKPSRFYNLYFEFEQIQRQIIRLSQNQMIIQSEATQEQQHSLKEIIKNIKKLDKQKKSNQIGRYMEKFNNLEQYLLNCINNNMDNQSQTQAIYIVGKIANHNSIQRLINGIILTKQTLDLLVSLSKQYNKNTILQAKILKQQTLKSVQFMIKYLKHNQTKNNLKMQSQLNLKLGTFVRQLYNLIVTNLDTNSFKQIVKAFQILSQSTEYMTDETKKLVGTLFLNIPPIYPFIIDLANNLGGPFMIRALEVVTIEHIGDNLGRYVELWEQCVIKEPSYLYLLPSIAESKNSEIFLKSNIQQSIFRQCLRNLSRKWVIPVMKCLIPFIQLNQFSKISLQQRMNQILRNQYQNISQQERNNVMEVFVVYSGIIYHNNTSNFNKFLQQVKINCPHLLNKINSRLSLDKNNKLQSCNLQSNSYVTTECLNPKQLATQLQIIEIQQNSKSQTFLNTLYNFAQSQIIWKNDMFQFFCQISQKQGMPSNIIQQIVRLALQGIYHENSAEKASIILMQVVQKYKNKINLNPLLENIFSMIMGNRKKNIQIASVSVIGAVFINNSILFQNYKNQIIGFFTKKMDMAQFKNNIFRKIYIIMMIKLLSEYNDIDNAFELVANIKDLALEMSLKIQEEQLLLPFMVSGVIQKINQFQYLSQKIVKIRQNYPCIQFSNLDFNRISFEDKQSEVRKIFKVKRQYHK